MSGADVFVLTWREGLLSRFGHDLRLRVRDFEVELDAGRVRGRFGLGSLAVDGALVGGRIDHGAISPGDRRDIERTIATDVLPVRRHPDARFEGRATAEGRAITLTGELALAGRSITLGPIPVGEREGAWRVSVEITPSRFGIAPYRALAGALKVQDRVLIELVLPKVEGVSASQGRATWRSG